jgi:hypothetical protein
MFLFVPMSFGDSSLTNAGASLEMVLKGFHARSPVWGRGWEIGAKDWEVF